MMSSNSEIMRVVPGSPASYQK